MPVPTYDQFIEPVLRYLAKHPDGASARDVHEASATLLQLSDTDRQELLPSGKQLVYKNRAGWAHDRLKRAGLSTSSRRGVWQLTPKGQEFVQAHPQALSLDEVEWIATGNKDVRLGGTGCAINGRELRQQVIPVSLQASPDDRLEEALHELRQTVAAEVMEALKQVSPSFFETIVLDLLHRMGYGASRADLQRVGGVGDAGIDGIISLDRLGLEKVYVQAKRWQQTVGRPEVQAFYGALAGQHATKGVFITTSAFTTQATDFARSVKQIVLVDGARLANLMIDYEVGVTLQPLRVPTLDSDYFDNGVA